MCVYEHDRSFSNLGEMRAASANSVYFWNRLKSIDAGAVPDETWVAYLERVNLHERRWR